jgi:hypothetical protein
MRSTNNTGVAAPIIAAAALLGCAAPDEDTTLAELERANAVARVSIERDACSCSCGQLVCWNFTCSGTGCSRADEYDLIVERDLATGDGPCPEAATGLTARLLGEDGEPLATDAAARGCSELSFSWRGPRAGLESRPHRIEISDASASWSIDDPFTLSSLAVVEPASAVSSSPTAPATVLAGDAIAFSLAPAARLTEVRASLRSAGTPDPIELPVRDVREDALELIVPSGTPPGLYDLQLDAGTLLPAGACRGPAVCRGLDIGTSSTLRVE